MKNNDVPDQLHVNIVLHPDNRSWIIEKIALKLQEHASEFGVTATVGEDQRSDVSVNHWMSFAFANVRHMTPATMFITHIDDPFKLSLVKNELVNGVDVGICMSSHMAAELVARGVDAKNLCYVSPAHDGKIIPRRIIIGLTTRLYPDGRKREALLLRLAQKMRLDAFRFDIFGAGWDHVVPVLSAAGAEVRYFPGTPDYQADYNEMMAAIPNFDYYVYLGLDEGSLGTLDALSAGVKTIVTPQGFHVDLPDGMTHPFTSFEDLYQVFINISEERQARINAVKDLTWREYARKHSIIWKAIANDQKEKLPLLLSQGLSVTHPIHPATDSIRFYLRYFNPIRIRSWLSHFPILKPVRAWVKSRSKK